jgi:hypothetical protein
MDLRVDSDPTSPIISDHINFDAIPFGRRGSLGLTRSLRLSSEVEHPVYRNGAASLKQFLPHCNEIWCIG